MGKTKTCTTCGVIKPLTEYSPRKDRPLGVHYSCKSCLAEKARVYRRGKEYSEEEREAARIRSANWRKENPVRNSEMKKNWAKRNRHKKLQASARYKLERDKRSPNWLSAEDKERIDNYYWLASDLKNITGEDYHVDHIVPLKGKNVSGLHVPWNLQVLPSDINLSKGNKHGF